MDRSIATRPTLDQWIRHHLAVRALSRRMLLGGIGGLTGLTLLGCSSGDSGGTTGAGSTTGVPLNLILNIVNVSNQCAPILTAMVYVWHCDKDGSGYNQSGADLRGQTFLRGVQTTDTSGRVTFNTIYPGWYPGRATHIHFRVYSGLALQATSQLAFPSATTSAVYSTPLYVAKGQNPTTPSSDGIFSDGVSYQLPIVTANAVTGGYDAELTVGIAA